jgi:hypothetical protein
MTPFILNIGTIWIYFIVKNHIYMKIFVGEKQYRRLYPVRAPPPPIPDATNTLYFTCFPPLPSPSLITELEQQLISIG